jgi:hypothetical protein
MLAALFMVYDPATDLPVRAGHQRIHGTRRGVSSTFHQLSELA